jgi:hypothetical protein
MAVLQALLAFALLLAALAPVLMAGGACIAAFMLRRHMLKHLLFTTALMATLGAGAFTAIGPLAAAPKLVQALVLALPVWLLYLAGQRFWIPKTP